MHSVICIKQVPAPRQVRARFLSNTIVQPVVPSNRRDAVAAAATPSSVTSRAERSSCTRWDRAHSSSDCGRCVPWVPKLRCYFPSAPLLATRRYPRRKHARPRSERSGRCLVAPLSCSLASRASTVTLPKSAPGHNVSLFVTAQPTRRNRWPRSHLLTPLAPSVKGPVLRKKDPGCKPRATG